MLPERFCQDPLENCFGMAGFGYNNNAIRNQKHFKPIANDNVVGSSMIVLTDEPLPCRKPKNEWKFKCKS